MTLYKREYVISLKLDINSYASLAEYMPSELRSQTQASSTLSFNEILDNKTLHSSTNATPYTNKCFIHLQQPPSRSMSNIISLNKTLFSIAKLNSLQKRSSATPPPNHAACQ